MKREVEGRDNLPSLKLDFNERCDSSPFWLNANNIEQGDLWQYPEKNNLQKIVAKSYSVQKKQVMLTNGGDEAIELLFKLSKVEGRRVVIPLPAFSQYLQGVKSWQLDNCLIEPNIDLSIDLTTAISKLQRNDILFITSPNNPTGQTLSLTCIKELCLQVKSKGALLFLDQAYIEFANYSKETVSLIEQYDNLILLRTLSKAYGLAGIRLGYVIAQSELIKRLAQLSLPFNISLPSLKIAEQAFSSSAQQEVAQYCQIIASNRKLLIDFLYRFPVQVFDSQANFLLIKGPPLLLLLVTKVCAANKVKIKTNIAGLVPQENYIRITIPLAINSLIEVLELALSPQLLCFDMDGVLIDTSQSYDQAIKETVCYFIGKKPTDKQIKMLRLSGGFNNDWRLTEKLLKQQGVTVDFSMLVKLFQQFYLGSDKQQGFVSLESSLLSRSLKNLLFVQCAKLFNTAVVTGRPRIEAEQGLELIQVKNTLLISDEDVSQSKPSPEGILKAKQYFAKQRCWMFGDTADDMLAAKAANAVAIGIGDKGLYQYGADIVLDNVNQLEELL